MILNFSWETTALAFVTGLGLIVAIGPQNIFVIKIGLQRRNVFLAATIAATCDLLLVALGTIIMTSASEHAPIFVFVLRLVGCAFLIFFGGGSLLNAVRKNPKGWELLAEEKTTHKASLYNRTLVSIVLPTLAFSLLNPHVYLDTVLVLGGLGSRMSVDNRLSFVLGAGGASYFWFYLTGFFARIASRVLARPSILRLIDGFVGVAMLIIAYCLMVP